MLHENKGGTMRDIHMSHVILGHNYDHYSSVGHITSIMDFGAKFFA